MLFMDTGPYFSEKHPCSCFCCPLWTEWYIWCVFWIRLLLVLLLAYLSSDVFLIQEPEDKKKIVGAWQMVCQLICCEWIQALKLWLETFSLLLVDKWYPSGNFHYKDFSTFFLNSHHRSSNKIKLADCRWFDFWKTVGGHRPWGSPLAKVLHFCLCWSCLINLKLMQLNRNLWSCFSSYIGEKNLKIGFPCSWSIHERAAGGDRPCGF